MDTEVGRDDDEWPFAALVLLCTSIKLSEDLIAKIPLASSSKESLSDSSKEFPPAFSFPFVDVRFFRSSDFRLSAAEAELSLAERGRSTSLPPFVLAPAFSQDPP
jgi:hypothetical protein